jgi:hypothetical protein
MLMLAVAGCGGSVPAPKAVVAYNSTAGWFACDYPKGWEVSDGAKPESPYSSTRFTSGNAEIRVDCDFAGSLYGDIAKAGGAHAGGDAEDPVAKVHPQGIRHMKDEFSNYTEREPTAFQSKGLGEGRKAIWIADQSFGGKIYGYRATLLTGDRRITVLTYCPAPNWQTLKPAFDKFILGLRRVGG